MEISKEEAIILAFVFDLAKIGDLSIDLAENDINHLQYEALEQKIREKATGK